MEGRLADFVVVGAMKCGTTALHGTLDRHPRVDMSQPKELNFFFGPDVPDGEPRWADGNWHRGVGWYAGHFSPDATVRGESSPGYTSPDHPEVAGRMARVLPHARLVYLVRDPVDRAVSQYLHHRDDGTEHRPLEEALLDPASQYVARGRYHERLAPFLDRFPREAIAVVTQEDLFHRREATLEQLLDFLAVEGPPPAEDAGARRPRAAGPVVGEWLRSALAEAFRDDADRLRDLAGRKFPWWSV